MVGRLPAPSPIEGIFTLIANERSRQNELKAAGRFAYTCADNELSDADRDTILTEEVGEVSDEALSLLLSKCKGRVSHEVNEGIGPGRTVNREALRKELIQVAAVVVAWLENIQENSNGQ